MHVLCRSQVTEVSQVIKVVAVVAVTSFKSIYSSSVPVHVTHIIQVTFTHVWRLQLTDKARGLLVVRVGGEGDVVHLRMTQKLNILSYKLLL